MVVQVDACPTGAGGTCSGLGFYALPFPIGITSLSLSIASLECFNVLIPCRLWGPAWAGKHILLYSDNAATVAAVNSGAAHDPLIRASVREMWLIAAIQDVELVVRHRPGASMKRPMLSVGLTLPNFTPEDWRFCWREDKSQSVRWEKLS